MEPHIDSKMIQSSKDALFVYTALKYGADENEWIAKDQKNQTAVKEYVKDPNVQILDHTSSSITGFKATLIQRTNEQGNVSKILAIAGTDGLSAVNDLVADSYLIDKNIPPGQFKVMTEFVDRLIAEGKISPDDDLTAIAHSLGGAEAQIMTAAYSDYVDRAYTMNSPGAVDLVETPNIQQQTGWDAATVQH